MNTVKNQEYTIDIQDPSSGNDVVITAKLYSGGEYYNYQDETGYWSEIVTEPEFHDYNYVDGVTEAFGIMPEEWKSMVDLILRNIYWDRELNR